MNTVRRIARNTVSLSIAELIGKMGQFFIFVYIARVMGKEVFGVFNFAYALSLIAVVFADIGINFMLVREMSKNSSRISSYVGNSFMIKCVFSALTFILVLLLMHSKDFPATTRAVVYLLYSYIVLRSFCELFFSVFKTYEKMHYEAIIKFISTVIMVIFVFSSLFLGLGIVAVSLAYVLMQFLVFIITYILLVKKFAGISFRFDAALSREIIRKALPFGFSIVFANIYFYIDSVMLSFIKGDEAVGIYSAAYNITLAILVIPSMYTLAIYPILSRNFGLNSSAAASKIKMIYERSFKYLYIIGLPISIGIFVMADGIIRLVYGPNYQDSSIALQILAWFVFMKFLSYLTGIVLSSMDRQDLRMYSMGASAFANLAANIILIPKYGIIGAGISTLFSELVLFVSSQYFVSRHFHKFNIKGILIRPIIASAAMWAFLHFIRLPVILSIISGAIIYALLVLLLKSFDRQDIIFIKKIFPYKGIQRMVPYEE